MEIDLRILTPDDVGEAYVRWFADPDVVRFSDNRFRAFSLDGQRRYVAEKLTADDEFLYGIFIAGVHAGNVMLGPVDARHRHAEVTYVLGERRFWGQGVATQAVKAVVAEAFGEHDLVRVYAGVYAGNIGSIRVLEKAGFTLEGTRRGHFAFEGGRMDLLEYGQLRP